jgi:hypothetical protein
MKAEITDKQLKVLKLYIQEAIDSELNNIKLESEDWGLGEMDDIDELESIESIIVDRIVPYLGIVVYVIIKSNNEERDDFGNIIAEINYRVRKWVPNVKIFIDSVEYL